MVQDELIFLGYKSLEDGRGRVMRWNVSAPGWSMVGPAFFVPSGSYNLIDFALAVRPQDKRPLVVFHVRP